jgi:hypothetical protein
MQTAQKYNKKYKITKTIKDAYPLYKNNNPNSVDKTTFVKICKEFNKKIIEKIINTSFELRLPYRLGFLRVRKCLGKIEVVAGKLNTVRLKPDWNACWEYWYKIYEGKTRNEIIAIPNKKLIYHYNDETNGYYYKFFWDRRECVIRNQAMYKFRPTMGVKKILTLHIQNEDRTNDFYE